jgi:hypothetical protein
VPDGHQCGSQEVDQTHAQPMGTSRRLFCITMAITRYFFK